MKLTRKVLYIFFPLILGSLVGFIISGSIDYKELIQPPLAPPSFLFPVMWSIIYLLMGGSYYLIKQVSDNEYLSKVYYLQLVINLLWSIIFFVFKLRFVACIWIVLLDMIVSLMIYWFYSIRKVSGYLNILYMIWILFATYLTIGIYVLN